MPLGFYCSTSPSKLVHGVQDETERLRGELSTIGERMMVLARKKLLQNSFLTYLPTAVANWRRYVCHRTDGRLAVARLTRLIRRKCPHICNSAYFRGSDTEV